MGSPWMPRLPLLPLRSYRCVVGRSVAPLVSARVPMNFVDDIINVINVIILVILELDVEVSLDGDHELDDVEGVEAQSRERHRVVHARLGRQREASRAATTGGDLEHRRAVELRTEEIENLSVCGKSRGHRNGAAVTTSDGEQSNRPPLVHTLPRCPHVSPCACLTNALLDVLARAEDCAQTTHTSRRQ